MTGDLFLDRDREVWRRVHSGDLVRLTIGGYISPPRRMRWVNEHHGPLVELVPAAPTTSPTPLTTDDRERVMHTIRVYQDEAGGWRWQRRAGNGEIISSGESHTRRSDALRAVRGANLDNEWTYHRDTVRGDDE